MITTTLHTKLFSLATYRFQTKDHSPPRKQPNPQAIIIIFSKKMLSLF